MTRQRLVKETEKWKSRLEERISRVEPDSEEGENFIENINAYLEDSDYFKDDGDYVRAFECVIWGWAWLEIGEQHGFLRERNQE
ncbi:DUF357 domain-containing protein [Methanonatronarchaeum sp. AMET6-2]|uniref:DUF357 domain-containing protein n=1 Tax=Methanonatronarchaeum sp. AMET6-2 TaxID=2933293 RepID=UPI001FF32E44|nr:DUF357 domain-containing protein [Methanonatronarchaeum sp. AMET6-2]UOY09722.1 DUF357 domain-containing protein [Methanonatronarchaeum sp. AMET6-2]